jgi:hypothetical protein
MCFVYVFFVDVIGCPDSIEILSPPGGGHGFLLKAQAPSLSQVSTFRVLNSQSQAFAPLKPLSEAHRLCFVALAMVPIYSINPWQHSVTRALGDSNTAWHYYSAVQSANGRSQIVHPFVAFRVPGRNTFRERSAITVSLSPMLDTDSDARIPEKPTPLSFKRTTSNISTINTFI